jgi:hypothetical protein
MQNTESVFFICCAVVISTMIIAASFGSCDQNMTPGLEKYKICMAATKDPKQCDDPFKK